MHHITFLIPVSSLAEASSWAETPLSPLAKIQFLCSSPELQQEITTTHPTLSTSASLFYNWGEQTSVEAAITEVDTPFMLLLIKHTRVTLGHMSIERMLHVAHSTAAGIIYADRHIRTTNSSTKETVLTPLIDYQFGSIRDDFNFGALLLVRTDMAQQALTETFDIWHHAALYHLRLKISQFAHIVRIPEPLYTEDQTDLRSSGEQQFDYVDPRNRARQLELEQACTLHLKAIGAYLHQEIEEVDLTEGSFTTEASVIIPVRNRERTIASAIHSALAQQTDFTYNVIVIDNHSTDATSQIIREIATTDQRLILITPHRHDLGIGGCWNIGIQHEACGRFAIQLDSDDLYSSPHTLTSIVNTFYEEQAPMVIGTYQMTNFDLQPIPPGIIDHREWTPKNGRNNALRINGLGAPRAFFTPLLRTLLLPNTSYGEDYAIGLRIARNYRIGRVYDVVYNCRRWDDNSDAALSIEKANTYNHYKDTIRTWEIQARIAENKARR